MLKGRIININSTKYLVSVNDKVYDCTLRGKFRNDKITPLVGDFVNINEKDLQIMEIFPRLNMLKRPNIANVDYALVVTSTKKPDLDLYLLDKLLTTIKVSNIKAIICFTKLDLLNELEQKEIEKLTNYYRNIGYDVITNNDTEEFKKRVNGKVVVACGQTGAGKSTFINKIDKTLNLETKPISDSLNRGVHTTRYVSLYTIDNFYLADTPGFSLLDISFLTDEQIKDSFIEFNNYQCKYKDCSHINTEGCEIYNNQDILSSRYDNYVKLIKEKHESRSKLFK